MPKSKLQINKVIPSNIVTSQYYKSIPGYLTDNLVAQFYFDYYIVPLSKLFIMGAPILTASVAGFNALTQPLVQQQTNRYQAHLQEELQEDTQAFNAEEAEKNRVFQHNERLAQEAYNTSERQAAQQYNTQERLAVQDYNSIHNQMSQLKAEGVNPAVYFSGSSGRFNASSPASSSGATSSLPSGSAASSGIASAPAMQAPLIQSLPQLMSGFSDLMNAFNNKNVGDAQANLFNEQALKVVQEAYGQQLVNVMQQMNNTIRAEDVPYAVGRALNSYIRELVDIKAQESQVDVNKSIERLNGAYKDVQEQIKKCKGQEFIILSAQAQHANELIMSDIQMKRANANASNASAEYQNIINSIYKDKGVRDSITIDLMQAAVNANKDGKIKDAQVRVIQHSADMLKKATDNYEIQMWSNIFNQSIQTVTDALGTYAKNKISKDYIDAIKNRPQPSYTRDAYGGPGYFNYPYR